MLNTAELRLSLEPAHLVILFIVTIETLINDECVTDMKLLKFTDIVKYLTAKMNVQS